jgi:hypothetical protein
VIEDLGFVYNPPIMLMGMFCGADLFIGTIPPMGISAITRTISSSLDARINPFVNVLFSEGTLLFFKVAEFMEMVNSLAVVSLMGFFAPAISMVFTVAFINALTKFIVMKG